MAYPGSTYDASAEGESNSLFSDQPDRPVMWKVPKKENPMYKFQSSLPRLPIPSLDQTCMKYLRSVRPLLTDEEFAQTTTNVTKFLLDGSGDELQRRLLSRAGSKDDSSWLIDWWNGLSYFGYRDPVVFYVSYFYQFKDELKAADQQQCLRAAKYVKASLKYRELILSEQLAPEMSGKDPQDMSMYKYLFNACRMPKMPADEYITYDGTFYHHIIVVRKNKFYKLDVVVDGWELSTAQIEAQMQKVVALAGSSTASVDDAIGLLTSDGRDAWTRSKSKLLLDPTNAASMAVIESAILVVCLDDESSPLSNADERMRALWHGDGCNRFFDKPMQYIVGPNGQAGFMGEHGMMDGTPTLQAVNWTLDSLHKGQIDHSSRQVAGATSAPDLSNSITQCVFNVNAETKAALASAQATFQANVDLHDVKVVLFDKFGKNAIKKDKISPDAFCQLAIQLAFARCDPDGKCAATYESCSVRKFLHGRTETIRSCSIESTAFVNAMLAGGGEKDPVSTYNLLQVAATAQSAYARSAAQGMGVDRHLLGLKLLKDDSMLTPIFDDPAYSRSSHWKLSTSTLASEHFTNWGFGEVVPDGYGVGYMCNAESVNITVTSRNLGADRFGAALEKSLSDIHALCQAALTGGKSKL